MNDGTSIPMICSLAPEELRDRRRTILDAVRRSAIAVQSSANGYTYAFKAESDTLQRLTQLVDLERQCCQFLTFKIVVEPQQPIRLEITGPRGAKSVIGDFFGS